MSYSSTKSTKMMRNMLEQKRALDLDNKSDYHESRVIGMGHYSGSAALGEKHAKEILDLMHSMKGSGMSGGFSWGDFKSGFKKAWNGYRSVTKAIKPIANVIGVVGGPKAKILTEAFLAGDRFADKIDPLIGKGKSGGAKNMNDKRYRRGMKCKELMQKKGLSFGEASKYIKDHNVQY